MSEQHFAAIYDFLMKDAPYEQWLQYATERLPQNGKIVDLACGTGTFTLMLYERGYDVIGVDISQDMLAVCEQKFRSKNISIPLVKQDMRHFSGFSQLDGVTIFCDGLNYLTDEHDVKQTFKNVSQSLKPGGVFLFDVHSTNKMEETFHNELYGENGVDVSYLWFTSPGDEPYSVEHTLTFFVKNNIGTYDRIDEVHEQRTFPVNAYIRWLEEAQFEQIEVTTDFGKNKFDKHAERIFFYAKKCK